jgi:hypothetical protein
MEHLFCSHNYNRTYVLSQEAKNQRIQASQSSHTGVEPFLIYLTTESRVIARGD